MTREQEIRARLKSASRAFSFLGAIGVAKTDVEYLLDRVDTLESQLARANVTDFLPTSLMHRKPHASEHMVRIYDMGDVHAVCRDCGMHDWGDWGNDESKYTVENFRAKYGDRVLEVVSA